MTSEMVGSALSLSAGRSLGHVEMHYEISSNHSNNLLSASLGPYRFDHSFHTALGGVPYRPTILPTGSSGFEQRAMAYISARRVETYVFHLAYQLFQNIILFPHRTFNLSSVIVSCSSPGVQNCACCWPKCSCTPRSPTHDAVRRTNNPGDDRSFVHKIT